MTYEDWEDKRKFKRYVSDLKAHFGRIGANGAEDGEGDVRNISRGGIFIHTEKPLPIGSEIKLKVTITSPFGEQQEVESEAKVVWISQRAGEEGMGLSFMKIDRHSQYALLASAYRGHD